MKILKVAFLTISLVGLTSCAMYGKKHCEKGACKKETKTACCKDSKDKKACDGACMKEKEKKA